MKIEFANIWEKACRLSRFEGRRMTDAQGESMYDAVALDDRDAPFAYDFVRRAAATLGAALGHVVESCTEGGDGGVEVVFVDEKRLRVPDVDTLAMLMAVRVMEQWLADKSKERSTYYGEMFAEVLTTVRMGCVKARPKIEAE